MKCVAGTEPTRAVTDIRELLQILASVHEVTSGGLVQTLAPLLLRRCPLDADLDVSAWSCPCNSGHADSVRLMTPEHA